MGAGARLYGMPAAGRSADSLIAAASEGIGAGPTLVDGRPAALSYALATTRPTCETMRRQFLGENRP